jgi:plastocyanin
MGKALGHLPALILCGLLALGAGATIAVGSTPPGRSTTHPGGTPHRCAHHARAKHRRRHARCHKRGKTMLEHAGPTTKLPGAPSSTTPTTQTGTSTLTGSTPAPGAGSGGGEAEQPTTAEPPSVPHVQVTAVEYSFTLSRSTVPAGKVIFEFVNNGQDEHNLNIASPKGELASSFANTQSRGVHDQTVEMRAGTYVLFCSLPEHESKGMKATLVVQ